MTSVKTVILCCTSNVSMAAYTSPHGFSPICISLESPVNSKEQSRERIASSKLPQTWALQAVHRIEKVHYQEVPFSEYCISEKSVGPDIWTDTVLEIFM